MNNHVIHRNTIIVISLVFVLLFALIFTNYATEKFHYNLMPNQYANNSSHIAWFVGSNSMFRPVEKRFKIQLVSDQTGVETLNDKIHLRGSNKVKNYINSHLSLLFIYLLTMQSSNEIFKNFRGWLVNVSQYLYKLFLVRYVQLKDGKKSALSLVFSF